MTTCRTCAYLRKCIEKATKEGYEHNADFDPKDGCTGIGYKSNTNADRIRAMSDEELARFLAENEWECETYNDCAKCPRMTDDGCVSLSKWLKQPAEKLRDTLPMADK